MSIDIEYSELVRKIISFNHCWKMAQTRFGASSPITKMLRDQKSVLQCALLRKRLSYLKIDNEAVDEPLYSVRLIEPITINGCIRTDAEHLPVRLAEELLTQEEITKLTRE